MYPILTARFIMYLFAVVSLQNFPARNLPPELTSISSGMLYITKTANGDVYVNNAKIVPEFSKVYDIPDRSKRKVRFSM